MPKFAGAPRRRGSLVALLALMGAFQFSHAADIPPYKNPKLPVAERVKDLLSRMTLEEKLQQLRSSNNEASTEKSLESTGFGFFLMDAHRGDSILQNVDLLNRLKAAAAHSRLQIPALPYDEALHGLLLGGHTSFPQAIGLAATWDPALIHTVAQAIADETQAQGVRQVLSPVVNVVRDSRWGRTEESYGEDPYLSSEMSFAYVSSFTQDGVICTPKHFIANYGDGGRDSNSVHTSERQLLDVYAPPFAAAYRAGALSTMVSYNALNGVPCAADPFTLQTLLRDKLGFKGYVVSDWGASNNVYDDFHYAKDYEQAAAMELTAGMDVEDPGVLVYGEPLEKAVKDHLVSMKVIDRAVTHVLTAKFQIGLFDQGPIDAAKAESVANSEAHQALAYKAAIESAVLLKNDNHTLPFGSDVKHVLVLGDLAKGPVPLGDYSGDPGPLSSLLDGLKTAEPGVQFDFMPGCTTGAAASLVPIPAGELTAPNGDPGLKAEYFNNVDLTGTPDFTETDKDIDFDWTGKSPGGSLGQTNFSVRWTGKLTVPTSGTYRVSTLSDDGSRVYIDGKLVVDNWKVQAAALGTGEIQLTAGVPVSIRVEYFQAAGQASMQLGLSLTNQPTPLFDEITTAAKSADRVVVFAGINEGEGSDRAFLNLPGNQEKAIAAAVASGTPVTVVLVSGAAVTMRSWIDSVPAILDVWYPGEEGPKAVADLLFGNANPGGKLPITFPKSVGQEPLYYNTEMTGRGFDYSDESFAPQFAFGHGLSYTTFTMDGLKVEKPVSGEVPYTVSVDVTNTGTMAGDEVVQLYVHQHTAVPMRALKQLVAFKRVHLAPGEKKTVTFTVGKQQLGMWDAKLNWVVEPSHFDLMVGDSSDHIEQQATIQITQLLH